MLVKEVMSRNVISIDQNKNILDACNLYKEKKVGCLLVTNNGKCVGILTERDIIERTICAKKDPVNTFVKDIMSSDVITAHALDRIESVLELMEFFKIKKIPVVADEEIIGIITVTDISKARPDLSERFIESWVKARWKD